MAITREQAGRLKSNHFVTDGKKTYVVKRSGSTPHDLWFWICAPGTRTIDNQDGGRVRRVYLGSKNVLPSNLQFLDTISLCDL